MTSLVSSAAAAAAASTMEATKSSSMSLDFVSFFSLALPAAGSLFDVLGLSTAWKLSGLWLSSAFLVTLRTGATFRPSLLFTCAGGTAEEAADA